MAELPKVIDFGGDDGMKKMGKSWNVSMELLMIMEKYGTLKSRINRDFKGPSR
jgi:hypothetical protein